MTLASPWPRVLCRWMPCKRSRPSNSHRRRVYSRTCTGLAKPVVSDRPTSSQPAAISFSAISSTLSRGTGPSRVQPKAVDSEPSRHGRCPGGRASMAARMACTSCNTCSWVRRRFLRLWVSLTDRGMVILWGPTASAFSAPRRLGTSTATASPSIPRAWATSSAVSASCGSTLAGTNEPTSISGIPAAASADIQAFLAAVGMMGVILCRPSRGPTSLISISIAATAAHSRPARRHPVTAARFCYLVYCYIIVTL